MIGDYDDIATRAFDEPYAAELRALVRVCGDHFEHHGDPRGTLIALGEARYDATGRRAHELQRAIDEHVVAHHTAEVAHAAELISARACTLEWRCGRIYAAHLDTRRIAGGKDPRDAVDTLLRAPAARTMRRLVIRIRQDRYLAAVLDLLSAHAPRPPLEELFVLREVRPRRISAAGTGRAATMVAPYPELQVYGERDEVIPLMAPGYSPDASRIVRQLRKVAAPLDEHDRRLLGRALTAVEAEVRDAAVDRVVALGEAAGSFVDVLALLLQPGLGSARGAIECLRAIGPVARRALPVLIKVPGRVSHYDRDTRRAAGTLLASLR